MKYRAYPYLTLALLGFSLLVALPVSAQPASPGGNQSSSVDFASLAKAACHGTVSCQPNYPSCASWSGYSDCGDAWCGQQRPCGECEYIEGHLFCSPGPAWKQPRERFRVCFDQFGNSCTEWQQTLISSCGCP